MCKSCPPHQTGILSECVVLLSIFPTNGDHIIAPAPMLSFDSGKGKGIGVYCIQKCGIGGGILPYTSAFFQQYAVFAETPLQYLRQICSGYSDLCKMAESRRINLKIGGCRAVGISAEEAQTAPCLSCGALCQIMRCFFGSAGQGDRSIAVVECFGIRVHIIAEKFLQSQDIPAVLNKMDLLESIAVVSDIVSQLCVGIHTQQDRNAALLGLRQITLELLDTMHTVRSALLDELARGTIPALRWIDPLQSNSTGIRTVTKTVRDGRTFSRLVRDGSNTPLFRADLHPYKGNSNYYKDLQLSGRNRWQLGWQCPWRERRRMGRCCNRHCCSSGSGNCCWRYCRWFGSWSCRVFC